MPSMNTTPVKAKGFSLVEVLVTLLVVSIGLFSIMAVITVSLQLNSSSVYRTIASQQAYAMAEMLRANPLLSQAPYGSAQATFANPGAGSTSTSCWNAGCPTNTFIFTMLDAWNKQLATVLPSGAGTVCKDSTPNDGTPANWACDGATNFHQANNVVKVCWNESRIAASSSVSINGSVTAGGGGMLCTYTAL